MTKQELLENMKDYKKRKLYEDLWLRNDIVKDQDIAKTKNSRSPRGESDNSFSFVGKAKAESLIKIFGIKDTDLFREKFSQAVSGDVNEINRIMMLH